MEAGPDGSFSVGGSGLSGFDSDLLQRGSVLHSSGSEKSPMLRLYACRVGPHWYRLD